MAQRDFYEVLGVGRGASPDDIKKAYRAMARKYHPDVNKAPDAGKVFSEVQNAYDVLSDPKKRSLYDQIGHAGFEHAAGSGRAGRAEPGGGGWHGPFNAEEYDADDVSEIFETFFGGANAGRGFGGFGRGGKGRGAGRAEPVEVRHEVVVPFETVRTGGTEDLRIDSGSKSRTIEVLVPRGVEDGTQLRMRGAAQGHDLILTIRTRPHRLWRRGEFVETGRGLDLYIDVPLTFAEAALGATVHVPTPDGSVDLTIPPGTASGKKLRLRGKGLTDAQGATGDLYAVIGIVPPGSVPTPAEAEALRTMSGRGHGPRSVGPWRGSAGQG